MKCSAVLLQAARIIGRVVDGAAGEEGTTTMLPDEYLDAAQDGGVLFTAGAVRKVDQVDNNQITIFQALPEAVDSGDAYSLAAADYDMLLNAARSVFTTLRYLTHDETIETVADQESYTLPEGVQHICKVELATNAEESYQYCEHHYWEEDGGTLRFTDYRPQEAGLIIRLFYATTWEFDPEGELPEVLSVFALYLQWAIVTRYWRQYLQIHKQDEPIAVEMMNEAKMREASLASPKIPPVIKYG